MLFQKQSRYGNRLTSALGVLMVVGAAAVAGGFVALPELGAAMCRAA
jgi:hypothetical protein